MNMEVRGCAIYDTASHEFNPDGTSVMKKSFYHVVIDRAQDGPARVTCGHEHATAEEARECLGALPGRISVVDAESGQISFDLFNRVWEMIGPEIASIRIHPAQSMEYELLSPVKREIAKSDPDCNHQAKSGFTIRGKTTIDDHRQPENTVYFIGNDGGLIGQIRNLSESSSFHIA